MIDKNSKLIHKYYADKGFRNAEVSVRIDNDSILKQAVNVTFIVDRKRKIKIGEINFTGNEEFSDKRLRRTFKKTHQKSLNFFRGAKFNEEDFENDKELLLDFYNSKGFRNANIVADSIYAINDKRMGITLDISEGNKYYIRNVPGSATRSMKPTNWLGCSVSKKGSIYDKKSMYKRLGIGAYYNPDEPSITNLYKDQGYLTSQIDPAEIIIGKDSIDLEVRVFEGKQFTINNVGISGNMRLDDEVIRRELYTRPGELYNQSLLFQTIRTLGSMGHFTAEAIAPDIQPVVNSDELVDINWPLEEIASDQFQIAGGWGGGTFVGSVGVTLNNLSIKKLLQRKAPGDPTRWDRTSGCQSAPKPTVLTTKPSQSASPIPGWAGENRTPSRFRLTIPMRTTPITPGRKVPVISAPPVSRRDSASVWTGPTRTSRSMRKPATSATC